MFIEKIRSFFFRANSLNFSLLIGTSSTFWDLYSYPLYPYGFDDFIFIIYQSGKLKDEAPRSSLKPIAQWFAIIFIASIFLYVLRTIIKRRKRRIATRVISADETDEYFMFSFIDSVGVFLGNALAKIGDFRAERWFLISFGIFGLIFRIVYTDNLFVMYTESSQNRITSIEQLIQANIPITVDYHVSIHHKTEFDLEIKS